MTSNNRSKKSNEILLIFSVIYSLITIFFISEINRDQSASLGYVYFFPIFWIIGGLVLGLLFWLKKIRISTITDKVLILLSTPIPLLIFFLIWSVLPRSQSPTMTREYNNDRYRHREVQYEYSNGKKKRIEHYRSQDQVNDQNPFPKNDIWIKDSIWIYYSKDGKIEKSEDYLKKKI